MKVRNLVIILLCSALAAQACSDRIEAPVERLRLQVTLDDLQTRSLLSPLDGSRMAFSAGDRIGFYAYESSSSSTPFYENLEMEYVGSQIGTDASGTPTNIYEFEPVDKSIVVDYSKTKCCFAYCPYDPNMGDGTGDVDTFGIDVREEGSDRAIDLLWDNRITYESGSLSANFSHAFAMLMVYGGEGFSHLVDEGRESVSVITDDELIRAIMYKSSSTGGYASIKFKPDNVVGVQHKTFTGIKGEYAGRNAWCIIVPCSLRSGDEVGVETIVAVDDYGVRHNIGLAAVSAAVKEKLSFLQPGWRYPVELRLEELVPTIYTYGIEPWNRFKVEVSGTGINTHQDCLTWVYNYNRYVQLGRPASMHTDLQPFGDFDGERWKFYLNTDIGFSAGSVYTINRLEDELDGRSHSLVNFRMVGSPLVTTLAEGGVLRNLDFNRLNVSSTQGSGPVGGIVASMLGGLVDNCSVHNLSMDCPGRQVGAVTGTMDWGTISNCRVSGVMLGAVTSGNRLTGGVASGTLSGNDVSGLMFGEKN